MRRLLMMKTFFLLLALLLPFPSLAQFATPGTAPGAHHNSGTLVLLERHDASASASLDFTAFSAEYDDYELHLIGVAPGTTSTDLYLRFSNDRGATYITTGNYYWGHFTILSSGSNGPASGAGAGQIQITDAARMVTTAGTTTNAILHLSNMLNGSQFPIVFGTQAGWIGATTLADVILSGGYGVAINANAVRIIASSGTLQSGSGRLYGIARR